MSVQQVVAAVAPHDAVTDQALDLHQLLIGWGYESTIYAEHVDPELRSVVQRIERRPGDPDAVLLRYSIWSRAIDDVLAVRPRRLGMVFHNVTPPEFIRDVNPAIAKLCAEGRERLAELSDVVDVVLADSAYDARDLATTGFDRVRVVPMLLDLPRRVRTERPAGERPAILSVGRIVPNKRIELLIRAFALFQRLYAPDAELILIGSWNSFESYHEGLVRFVDDLAATGVRFLGQVTSEERDRWYRESHAYACTSTHEGFCAPLAEAMAAGLPVVAVDQAAVPETLAGGGLVVPDGDPCLVAEALQEVVTQPGLRAQLRAGAELRLIDFDRDRVAAQLHQAVRDLTGESPLQAAY